MIMMITRILIVIGTKVLNDRASLMKLIRLYVCPLEYWWMEGWIEHWRGSIGCFRNWIFVSPDQTNFDRGGENSIWRAELVIYFILCIQRCERLGTRLAASVIIELSRAMYQTFSFPLYNSGTIRFIGLKVNWNCNWSLYLSFEATFEEIL